ncbi:MAG TPA: histidine kinase dimerization/phospho-acceptor domain-containing protein [Chloroflexota bacterium]|jgi:signal transduction histidine kinase
MVDQPSGAAPEEQLRLFLEEARHVYHDVNNALAPVLGFTELLLEDQDMLAETEQLKHYLELIHGGAEDALRIVGNLRKFYRPEG